MWDYAYLYIHLYYFTHLGLFELQISSYCVKNTLFVDKQQQNGHSTTSSYDQKLKMSKVSLTTLQAVIATISFSHFRIPEEGEKMRRRENETARKRTGFLVFSQL